MDGMPIPTPLPVIIFSLGNFNCITHLATMNEAEMLGLFWYEKTDCIPIWIVILSIVTNDILRSHGPSNMRNRNTVISFVSVNSFVPSSVYII